MLKITICPSCGSNKIKKIRRNWVASLNDRKYTVPNLLYYECPECGEKVYDREAMRKIEQHSPAFERISPKRKSA